MMILNGPVHDVWGRDGGEDIEFDSDGTTVPLQIEIVRVFPKGIFNLRANGSQTEEKHARNHAQWDGGPGEHAAELEGQAETEDPEDLGDDNVVGDGDRGPSDSLASRDNLVHVVEVEIEVLWKVIWDRRVLGADIFHVRGKVECQFSRQDSSSKGRLTPVLIRRRSSHLSVPGTLLGIQEDLSSLAMSL